MKEKIFTFFKSKTGVFIVILFFVASYYLYGRFFKSTKPLQYVTQPAQKATMIVSVSGTGQISTTSQVDLKSKVSAQVTLVKISEGQAVKEGDVLVLLDSRDAQKLVRDAEVNLESAKINLAKLKQPADQLTLTQTQNSLNKAIEDQNTATNNLNKAYDDAFTNISSTFLDIPSAITSLQNILYGQNTTSGVGGQWYIDFYGNSILQYDSRGQTFKDDAINKYQIARTSFDSNFTTYKNSSRADSTSTKETLLNQTYNTAKDIADAIKSANNLIQLYSDTISKASGKVASFSTDHLNTLNSLTGKVNSHLADLSSSINNLQTQKNTITNSGRTIVENTESLNKLLTGATELDIKSAELTMTQRENELKDAQEKLADYNIRAPFEGVVAKLNVKKSDYVNSGTILASLILKQQVALISLNEIDAAKLKIGQKASIKLDALPELEISGHVASIDTLGTASQGVVSYNVQIALDTQTDQIKPGMSANAQIILQAKTDALLVPNSSVKTQNGQKTVQVLQNNLPKTKNVQTGLSNDTSTEILSGISENDLVITQTIDPNQSSQSTPARPANSIIPTGGSGLRGLGR